MSSILANLQTILTNSGFAQLFVDGGYRYAIMILVACVLLYLPLSASLSRCCFCPSVSAC